jgi:peptidoglycan hydrolase CwlO-like protein
MKTHKILILATLLIFSSFIYAQSTVQVRDINTMIDGNSRPAFVISSEAEAKPLMSEWKKFLKKEHKIKTRSSRSTITAEKVSIGTITSKQFDLFTLFNVTPQGTDMIVAASLGYDIYFSPNGYPEEYNRLKTLSTNFINEYLKARFDNLIKDKEKVVERALKDENNLIKDINKLEKNLEKENKQLQNLKKSIEKNKTDLDNYRKQLPEMKETIEEKRKILNDLKIQRNNLR